MAISVIFPNAADLSPAEHAPLSDAYEAACDELAEKHDCSPELLIKLIEPMTAALLTLYRAGEVDGEQLSRYAASQGFALNLRIRS